MPLLRTLSLTHPALSLDTMQEALSVSLDGSLTVKHTTNNAAVSGSWRVSGFIGLMEDLEQPTVISFEDCVNNGSVTGSGWYVGGFVGYIYNNTNMFMAISNSINNGIVNGSFYVGGLVGNIGSNTNMTITISNSINNGSVTGSEYDVGGFFGSIFSNTNMTMTISNSINNGTVTGGGYCVGGFVGACGIMYASFNKHIILKTKMKNSINKGSVSASTNGYGITNNITVARNVVSMGDVTGSSGSFTFWNASTDVDLFYGLDGKCINCSDSATLFKWNTSTGFYEVVETGEHVDDLLNDEAVDQHFGMVWTSQLELAFAVNVSGLWNGTLLAELGTPLNEVGNLSDYFNDEELCVGDGDNQPMIAFKPTHVVTRNMKVVVGKCMNVTVGAPINKGERMIAGETLDHLAFFFDFSLDGFIIVEKGSEQVLNQSSVIDRDTVLKLCHNVIVFGALNQTFTVEHGTTLGQITDLDIYFGRSFIIYDNSTNTMLTRETLVTSDVIAVITEVSKVDVVIKFDENENITVEEVENAIKDMIELPDDEHVWIEVISQGDNSFIISIKQTGGGQTDIVGSLKDCSLSKQ